MTICDELVGWGGGCSTAMTTLVEPRAAWRIDLPAHSVYVGLHVGREVEVDHVGHELEIDTT